MKWLDDAKQRESSGVESVTANVRRVRDDSTIGLTSPFFEFCAERVIALPCYKSRGEPVFFVNKIA